MGFETIPPRLCDDSSLWNQKCLGRLSEALKMVGIQGLEPWAR